MYTDKEIQDRLNAIHYIRLTILLELEEDTHLPYYKVSALRGGIGELLLQQNCIADRNCDACAFESECIVRRTMYSKYEIKPDFATGKDSIGYVLECDDHKTEFHSEDQLRFQLLLFGKSIVYISQYLQAIHTLGFYGLGKEKSRYHILQVFNQKQETLLAGSGQIRIDHLCVSTVLDYVTEHFQAWRQKERTCHTAPTTLVFRTPAAIKYQNELIRQFIPEAIFKSLFRRIYMFNCFEGFPAKELKLEQFLSPDSFGFHSFGFNAFPLEIRSQAAESVGVPRYSSTADRKMKLYGITGHLEFDTIPDGFLVLLLAGELIHVGKNTSFGFGKYSIR